MKRFVLQVIANAATVVAVALCMVIVPVVWAVSSVAHARLWGYAADVLGITEARCRRRHQSFHKLHPVSYGGDYLVECSLCRCIHYRHR